MSEKINEFIKFIIVSIIPIIIYSSMMFLEGGECIYAESVSKESYFQVNLTKDVKYELWVVDYVGPEKIKISIRKDSYIVLEDTFMLMHPEGDYLPYHPSFTVKENGTYQVHAKPLDSGTVSIGILEFPSRRWSIKIDSEHKKDVKLQTPSELKEELGI
ncbi:hypothetical protein ACSAZK_12925 [Methanosarcina sp. Mfa9]|uniref:hypothetical protein n=1 Tax=Methanosarcina sp. Mfa9 TaxID=3439063 RepID=UPI003F83104F